MNNLFEYWHLCIQNTKAILYFKALIMNAKVYLFAAFYFLYNNKI